MYIRWQSRQRRHAAFGYSNKPETHWRAILVESIRVDGKPRQRHIAFLVGFTESQVAIPAQQYFMWQGIEKQLDRLHNRISPDDRKRIEAILVEKIGKPPSKAQRAALDRNQEEFPARFAEQMAGPGKGPK